jgi:mycothiol synthase
MMEAQSTEKIQIAELPAGYAARSASMSDLEAVVELLNTHSRITYGYEENSVEHLRREWENEQWNLDRYSLVVTSPTGEIVGYQEVYNMVSPKVRPWIWGRVHPDHMNKWIGTHMLNWAETLLRSELDQSPEGAQVAMQTSVSIKDAQARKVLSEIGMEANRYFWRMVIEFDGALPEPELPEGITFRTLQQGEDERAAYRIVRKSFEDHWGFVPGVDFEEAFARWGHYYFTEDYDPGLRFLAMDGDQIVGVCMCQPKIDEDADMGWVGTLGVLREYRGRGIAKTLLLQCFGEFYRRGKPRVGLGVDASSLTGATKLYESVGMNADREFVNFAKELRAGEDITVQSARQ